MNASSLACVATLVATAVACADNVYVMSTEDYAVDQAYINALTPRGHVVTIGHPYYLFTANDLAGMDVVIITHGPNWSAIDEQVSVAGQDAILDFVHDGGGLITTEWVLYNFGESEHASYALIGPDMPAEYGMDYSTYPVTTLTRVVTDDIVDQGVAATFEVESDDYHGVESLLIAKPAATLFYKSSELSNETTTNAAASGWGVGAGHTVALGILPGPTNLANPNFANLLANLVSWAGVGHHTCAACPADFDQDGGVTGNDVSAFFNAFELGLVCADTDQDGGITGADVATFFMAFEAGGC